MKSYYESLIITLFFCLIVFNATAQNSIDRSVRNIILGDDKTEEARQQPRDNERVYRWAMRYLNGINTDVDYAKAFARFNYLAHQVDLRAINALAGMYQMGMGVPQDQVKARRLYKEASDRGHGKASHNLALMYKTAQGGEQDFEKALEYAQKAEEQGHERSLYFIGYMHFKGLGTTQDYTQAVKYFTRGTEIGQISCMYFLGMCYLGGFGVEQDIDKGKQLIQRAAELGNSHAAEFIVKGSIEKYIRPENIDPQGNRYPAFIRTAGSTAIDLSGEWTGRMLQYDHSGQRVMEDRSLHLQITDEYGRISGTWLHADSIAMELNAGRTISGIRSGIGALQAKNMQYLRTWSRSYEIRSLAFTMETDERGDTVLYAAVTQFSPQTMEYAAPTMLELRRTGRDGARPVSTTEIPTKQFNVYPNPFMNELTVEFAAPQAGQYSILIYDLAGRLLRTESVTVEPRNETSLQSKTFDTTRLPAATYSVAVRGKGLNVSTLVIKPVYY